MKKQNLMAGLCLSLATTFVVVGALIMPMMMNMIFNADDRGALLPKGILYMVAYGSLFIFGIVYTIMSIISICKLGKDDAVVAKKKGLFIATLVFQAILVVSGILATVNGLETFSALKALSSDSQEFMQVLMQYGGTSYMVLMSGLVVNVVAFVLNLVFVCKLKKPVEVAQPEVVNE